MRNVGTDRYAIVVRGYGVRTTTDDRAAAVSIARGMVAWPDHAGRSVEVVDRQAPPKEVKSIFGGTRMSKKPEIIWHFTARAA